MPAYQPKIKRIFVSSTFKDMQLERDLLRDRILPALNQFTEQYGLTVELVDLRWGVNTADMSEEASSFKVLKTCLDEIDRSRPIFVGFLGDRYGWVPTARELTSVTQSKRFQLEDIHKSVTALEIEYGALRAAHPPRCLFYYREGLDLSGEPEAVRNAYQDEDTLLERQRQLKQAVRERFKHEVKDYSARMQHHELQLSEDFEAVLRNDLLQLLSDLIAEEGLQKLTEALSWQQQTSNRMAAFAQRRLNRFAGRRQQISELASHATSRHSRRLLLLKGAPGTGKSALLCKLWQVLEQEARTVLPFFCGISARTSHVTGLLQFYSHQLSELLGLEDISESFSDFQQLRLHFATLLRKAGKKGRVVLLVDALDQLFPCEETRSLMWLPSPLPPNVRVICTMVRGEAEEKAALIRKARISDISAVTVADIREIAARLADSTGKELPDAVLEELLRKKDALGARSAGNPLYLSLLIQNLNMMDRYDHAAIDRDVRQGMAPMTAIIHFMKAHIRQSTGEPRGEYLSIINRMARLMGTDFVLPVLGMLAISRTGLRETDLAAAMKNMGLEYRSADFSWLRQILREHMDQGDEGQWDFSHGSLRTALLETLRDRGTTVNEAPQEHGSTDEEAPREHSSTDDEVPKERVATYNEALLKHFLTTYLQDDFAARELMHHFWTGGMASEAATLITKPQCPPRCVAFFAAGLAHICQKEGSQQGFVSRIIEEARSQDAESAYQLAELVAVHLRKALGQSLDHRTFLSLTNALIRLLEKNRSGSLYHKRFQKEADDETRAFFQAYSNCLHAKVACLIQLDRLQEAHTTMTQSFDGLCSRLLVGWTRDIRDYARYMEEEALKQELALRLGQMPLFLHDFSPPHSARPADVPDPHLIRAEMAFFRAQAQYAIHRYDYYHNLDTFFNKHYHREDAQKALDEAICFVKRVIATAERLCQAENTIENQRQLAKLYQQVGELFWKQETDDDGEDEEDEDVIEDEDDEDVTEEENAIDDEVRENNADAGNDEDTAEDEDDSAEESEAEEYLDKCLNLRADIYHMTALDADLVLFSDACCSMANIMWHAGYLGDMDDLSRRALNNLQRLYQMNPVNSVLKPLAVAQTTRGGYFMVTGDHPNAETLFRKALESYLQLYHGSAEVTKILNVSDAYYQLSGCLESMGKLQEAEQMEEQGDAYFQEYQEEYLSYYVDMSSE